LKYRNFKNHSGFTECLWMSFSIFKCLGLVLKQHVTQRFQAAPAGVTTYLLWRESDAHFGRIPRP